MNKEEWVEEAKLCLERLAGEFTNKETLHSTAIAIYEMAVEDAGDSDIMPPEEAVREELTYWG